MNFVTKALSALGLGAKSHNLDRFFTDGRRIGEVGDAGQVVTRSTSLALSAVWGCANLVSGTISSLPFEIHQKREGGHHSAQPDHPLHRILSHSPNYDQTALDFWDFLQLSLEMDGNAFAEIERRGDVIVALHPISPRDVSVRRLASGAIEYRYSRNGKAQVKLDREVFHVRGPGGDPLGGMSTLQFGRQAFSSALAADRAAGSMFRNELRPSMIIKFQEWLSPEQRDLVESEMVARYQGAMNAGRPYVVEGGVDVSQVSIKPEDAQMLETRQFSVEEICRFFGVPPVLIGHAGASTAWPTSVEQQMITFVMFTLRRRLKRLEQAMNKQLLSASDYADGFRTHINLEGLLRGDSEARSNFYQRGLQDGWLVINEVRGRENLAPVDGGDVPRTQMQNVPITEVGDE